MIISNKKFKEMCKLINTQRETIRLLEEQCALLKKIIKKSNLSSIYGTMATHDIDFPNSNERRQGESDTPDNLSDLFSNF